MGPNGEFIHSFDRTGISDNNKMKNDTYALILIIEIDTDNMLKSEVAV